MLWVGQHCSLATKQLQRDIIGFSATSRVQIAVSQLSLFLKVHQMIGSLHIVTPLPYHLAHVKAKCKRAASSPPPPSPRPCIIHLHFISGEHGLSLLSHPPFSPSVNSQRGSGFNGKSAEQGVLRGLPSFFNKDR